MKKQENNYAFIDSQNLNLGVQSLGWRLDFTRFRVYLREKYGVEKAFLFIGYIQENARLYDKLKKDGYIIIFKPVVQNHPDGIKGNVDAELVLHTMIEYPNYQQAVIATGDGDFACLVEYLHENTKLKKLLIPNRKRYSKLLRLVLPQRRLFLFLDQFSKKLSEQKQNTASKS